MNADKARQYTENAFQSCMTNIYAEIQEAAEKGETSLTKYDPPYNNENNKLFQQIKVELEKNGYNVLFYYEVRGLCIERAYTIVSW